MAGLKDFQDWFILLSFYLGYPDFECGGCLNQDGQDGRMFQDWGYPALSFYLGYPDSGLGGSCFCGCLNH
jgi:hypothetical protein